MSGLFAFQNTTTAKTSEVRYQYPQAEQQAYLKTCQQVSLQQGLTQQQAEPLCQCTLEQLKKQYTVDRFRELYQEATSQSDYIPTEFLKIGMLCVDQLTLN